MKRKPSGRQSKLSPSSKTGSNRSGRASTKLSKLSEKLNYTLTQLAGDKRIRPAMHPVIQTVQLATLSKTPPNGDDWMHEIKFDGYRMLCRIENGQVKLISRNGKDWTHKFPELSAEAKRIPVSQATLDGEIVAIDPDGVSRFQSLQNVFQNRQTGQLQYFMFDLLYLNGFDIKPLPLGERKLLLKSVLELYPGAAIHYSDEMDAPGAGVLQEACRLKLEGIISKRRSAAYLPGRGYDWLKIKCGSRAEFVIGGFTKPRGQRDFFGALLIGYYDAGHQFVYAGRVGTGFDQDTLASLYDRLARLEQPRSPFVNLSGTTGKARDVHWVKPELVAEIEFSNWTDDEMLRHPAFQGLREDKSASQVTRDRALTTEEVRAVETTTRAKPKSKPAAGKKSAAAKPTRGRASAGDARAEIAGVEITHPDKVLYDEQGITKLDLANYYAAVADWMLPHVKHRPLALVRCPGGKSQPCFFQKHPDAKSASYLMHVDISKTSTPEMNLAIDALSSLIELVQMGVLEIHIWGSPFEKLEYPDRLVFDLDPDVDLAWSEVVKAAREVKELLEGLGLETFLKTTGGKGLHIVVPVQSRFNWDETKAFCKLVADHIVRRAPDKYVSTMSMKSRKGKIFIDYLRNGRGATSIAPYSTRAKTNAPVSVPIAWNELQPRTPANRFTVSSTVTRLKRLKQDPWETIAKTRQSITKKMLEALME